MSTQTCRQKERNNLVTESWIARHNDCPPTASSCHGGYMEPFFPLLAFPLERKWLTYFVGLLSELCACRYIIMIATSRLRKLRSLELKARKLNLQTIQVTMSLIVWTLNIYTYINIHALCVLGCISDVACVCVSITINYLSKPNWWYQTGNKLQTGMAKITENLNQDSNPWRAPNIPHSLPLMESNIA